MSEDSAAESGRVTYRCIWCEDTFDANPEECIGCPYCLRHDVVPEEEFYECEGCGFVGTPRIVDYYDADLPVCRSCGQRLKEAENDGE